MPWSVNATPEHAGLMKDFIVKYQIPAEAWFVAHPSLTVAEAGRLKRQDAALQNFLAEPNRARPVRAGRRDVDEPPPPRPSAGRVLGSGGAEGTPGQARQHSGGPGNLQDADDAVEAR